MSKSILVKFLCILIFLALTAYCAWSWFFQTGLYAFLIHLQVKTWDNYFPLMTGIVMWIVLAVAPLSYAFGGKKKHEYQLNHRELTRRLTIRSCWFALSLLVFSGLSAGAYFLSIEAPGDDQEIVTIDLANYDPQSLWFKRVSLQGKPLTDSSTITEKNSKGAGRYFVRYTPITSLKPDNKPIHFVEAFNTDSIERISREKVSLSGFVMPMVLPVLIQDSLRKDGLVLANRTYILSNNVFNAKTSLTIAAAILGLISFFLLVGLLLSPLHNRRKLRERQEHQGNW